MSLIICSSGMQGINKTQALQYFVQMFEWPYLYYWRRLCSNFTVLWKYPKSQTSMTPVRLTRLGLAWPGTAVRGFSPSPVTFPPSCWIFCLSLANISCIFSSCNRKKNAQTTVLQLSISISVLSLKLDAISKIYPRV